MPTEKYEPLLGDQPSGPETTDADRLDAVYEIASLKSRKQTRTVRILVVLNVVLTVLLCAVVVLWWRHMTNTPKRPYSPAWEAVRYVNKRFGHEELFHRENDMDAELDAAWKNLTGPSTGHIRLPLEEAKKNIPTIELFYEPGYYLYGVSVFHQIHCLDSIRMAFYPDHYFPKATKEDVRVHKNHCLDYLRQSIMCSGDVTLDHWFNYTFVDPSFNPANAETARSGLDWTEHYSDHFRSLTPRERSDRAPMMWDTEHQCRDYDALWQWVKDRELVDAAYVKEFNRTEEIS